MKAVVFHKPKDMRVENVADPVIEQPEDVILKVTATAICGSDLHIYNGFLPQTRPLVMGHEFMGVVEEVGTSVTSLKKGDRVVVPFPIACGQCFFCGHGLPGHCETSNPEKYGPEGGTLDQKVLFLTDIFPTGYAGLKWANLQPGETVAVFGCGPVGLMAQKVAGVLGAKQVIGIDYEDYRLEMARRTAGSVTLNAKDDDVVEAIRDLTDGRGADVCIDAVGMEAKRSLGDKLGNVLHGQAGSIKALEQAISAVRRGGRIGGVGVYGMPYDNFPIGQIFDKGIQLNFGQATVHSDIDDLIEWVKDGRIKLDDIITHRLSISDAPHAYQIFNDKEDNCVKVILNPHA